MGFADDRGRTDHPAPCPGDRRARANLHGGAGGAWRTGDLAAAAPPGLRHDAWTCRPGDRRARA